LITTGIADGIRAYNYGMGDVTVNDNAGTINASYGLTSSAVDGFGDGINTSIYGSGSIYVTTATGVGIESAGSGISANNFALTVSSTSEIDIVAYGTIESGVIPSSSSGSPAAGILAGYNNSGVAENNVHGNVFVDDFASSITAATGTDGIRAYNYGTGVADVTVEIGATVNGSRYGVGAFGHDGGNVSVINYGSVTGGADAVDATTTLSGTATIDNHGHLIGDVAGYNATFTNELPGDWSMNGASVFTGTSTLDNAGTIESNGTSVVSGLASITNAGTIEVQSGSLDLIGAVSGAGTLKIDAGTTLELASSVSSDQTVTFSSTTGTLKLDNAQNFHGVVSGFSTTDGTQAHSDQIDLANINHDSLSFSESFNTVNDVLTVTDGTNTANIQFTGTIGSLSFVDDGNMINGVSGTSGTIVFDPPAANSSPVSAVVAHDPGPAPATAIVASVPNQTLTGGSGSNAFVFNFAGIGHDTVTNFHPATDTLEFGSAPFTNAQVALNAMQDDGHGNTVVTLDAHDAITLSGVLKAQLHASDFHFV
jgi:hypothetical protein